MLVVFARSFMIAARLDVPAIRDAPRICNKAKPGSRKGQCVPEGHWWMRNPRSVESDNL